jgi:outer membrane protein
MKFFHHLFTVIFLSFYGAVINAQPVPALSKIGLIDSQKVLSEIGESQLPKINSYLNEVAAANQIQIIFGSAAYFDNSLNITDVFIKGYKANTSAASLNLSNIKINPSVAVVNFEKIFNESKMALAMFAKLQAEFTQRQNDLRADAQALKSSAMQYEAQANSLGEREKTARKHRLASEDKELQIKQKNFTDDLNLRTQEERIKIKNEANIILAQLANKLGLSAIFQEAAYINPNFDVTADVIALLNRDKKIDQITDRPIFSNPAKVAVVMTEQLLLTFGDSTNMSNEERLKIRTEIVAKANPILSQFAKLNGISIVLERPNYAESNFDITAQLIALMKNPDAVPKESTQAIQGALTDAKAKCLDLGFREKTEAFGNCVLRLSK